MILTDNQNFVSGQPMWSIHGGSNNQYDQISEKMTVISTYGLSPNLRMSRKMINNPIQSNWATVGNVINYSSKSDQNENPVSK